MSHIDFALSIVIQQSFFAKILQSKKSGWICSIDNVEVFLPRNQLYKGIYDVHSVVGKCVKVLVQQVTNDSVIVSHRDFVTKLYERKYILQNLEKGQKLVGIVKHITDKGVYLSILGIIGYMPKIEILKEQTILEGQSIDVAVLKIDVEKSIFLLSSKLYAKIIKKENKEKEKAAIIEKRSQELDKIGLFDVLEGKISRKTAIGYELEISENVYGILPYSEIPPRNRYKSGDSIEVIVYDFDFNEAYAYVSINKLIEKKWNEVKQYFESSVIPNHTELNGRVVYIEKNLVTLYFVTESLSFYGYIKSEDLAWEKVQNPKDVVFLGEELTVRFLYEEAKQLYFDLKWQQTALYPDSLFLMDTAELLESTGVLGNSFSAKVSIITKQNPDTGTSEITAFASNIVSHDPNDNYLQLVDKYTGVNISALISQRYAYGLHDGAYYKFKLKAASTSKRRLEHRPYMFYAELDGGAIQMPDPFKEQVEKSFKENKTPKSNRESASYLKEIGADMYTDRDRMFYELLQNADDASPKKGVKVMVQVQGRYLIFTHDGFSFSRQDFRSIVSTANSTKRLDRKKTGYKGIGFKSVFTDSEKVYIRTGGFFFLFDKNAEIFKDFRAFYRFVNPLYTDEQFVQFLEENKEYEEEFEGVDHLPWQLLPIWVDDCPEQLQNTTFTRNCNVAIALDMGLTAEKYRDVIKGIIRNPRFMLFLRNTRRIQLEEPVVNSNDKKKWDIISIAKHVDVITGTTRLKNSFASKENEVSYIVREGSEIPVSNESFASCKIPMLKECKVVAGREKWFMYQIIDDMQTPITSIPERIIAADSTTFSYAFMLDEKGSAICIPDKTPSLYAFLPMEDRRYLFPFFINADFELSSNRQEAKQVSVWNEYIFYNIGKNIVTWVSSLAKPSHPLYLSLLPNHFFTEELEESKIDRLAAQFNRGYKEALIVTPFILNDKNSIVCQKDIVIDESGFAAIIGPDDFCSLMGKPKRMLHKNIDILPLYNKVIFSEIEHILVSEVVDKITNPKYRIQILRYWCTISSILRNSLLAHIANMPGNRKNLFDNLLDIPAYTCQGRLYSYNKLLKSDSIIIRCDVISGIEDIIEKLGIKITDENEVEHPFHSNTEEVISGYSIHVFDIIKERTSDKNYPITASEKYKLFSHFISSKRNIEHEKLKDWPLFCNQLGEIVSLSQLTHIDSLLYNNITERFVIDETEYNMGPRVIDRYLMKEKEQYDNIIIKNWESLILEVGCEEDKACSLYKLTAITYAVAEHEKAKEKQSFPLQDKKYVFANNQMHISSDVVINNNLSNDEKSKELIEMLTGKFVPSSRITKYIQFDPFNCKTQSIDSLDLDSDIVLSQVSIDSLLEYCLANSETLFTNYTLCKKDDGYVFAKLSKDNVVAYTNNSVLKKFIHDNCASIQLIPDEFSGYISLKGILIDDELLLKILDIIKDVNPYIEVLLPIYRNSISKVKTSFIAHLSRIDLYENSCIDENDIKIQTLLMSSSIEKPENELFDNLRGKIYITLGEVTTSLSNIKLEHTIEVNGKQYPLSKLLPNEDNLAKLVDSLRERIEEFVPVEFTNKLFGSEIDKGRTNIVFTALNKSSVVLENGAQVAFVLEYASLSNNSRLVCKVYDSVSKPNATSLCGSWILQNYSFINHEYILNEKYSDLVKYITLPYSNATIKCVIQKDLESFEHIKDSLTEEESYDILDAVTKKKS